MLDIYHGLALIHDLVDWHSFFDRGYPSADTCAHVVSALLSELCLHERFPETAAALAKNSALDIAAHSSPSPLVTESAHAARRWAIGASGVPARRCIAWWLISLPSRTVAHHSKSREKRTLVRARAKMERQFFNKRS